MLSLSLSVILSIKTTTPDGKSLLNGLKVINELGGTEGAGNEKPKEGAKMAYSFDLTALERAASAAKTLERSSNAKEALELTRLQEVTKQKESEASMKQMELKMATIKGENARIIEEERRKTLGEETKHAKAARGLSRLTSS